MASMIPHPLLCLALVLLLPQLTHSAPFPQPEHKQQTSNTYVVHANHLAKPSHFATLGHWYTSMATSHSSRLLYTYDTVMHGFTVQLTADEARRMASAAGVNAVYEDRPLHLLTTRTPGFLGLDPKFGAWRDTDSGDGIIDSGIWPESPSFSDAGLSPVRSSWRGKCVGAEDFNASLCNNKLVGAKTFVKSNGTNSPRDTFGHGTHVASIAAGAEVRKGHDDFHMFAQGPARGMAPKARITMYKVSGLSSTTTDTVAAIDAAVKDGVDIISISLGYDPSPFYNDPLAIATFGAEQKGVFVVLAGGNSGPSASTLINVAPWMTTVGAGTVDRVFPASLNLSFGCEAVIGESRAPMVAEFSSRGPNQIAPHLLKPDIIAPGVEIFAAWTGVDSPINARNDNYQVASGTSMSCPHVAGVAALIKKKHSDWTPAMIRSALITTAATLDNTDREIIDSAVVAGRGGTAATPFAIGAEHVRPQLAMDPGLVYDAGAKDYVDFLCALNYTAEQMRRFVPDFLKCTRTLNGGAAGLNYPSFVVSFDSHTDVRTLTRTLTKVSEEVETYTVDVKAPEHVKVIVSPTTLVFKEHMEARSYSVEFRNEASGYGKAGWDFGHIIWANEKHNVRSPVAFQWNDDN